MCNVVTMQGITKADDTPENILEKAKSWGMEYCIVIGVTEDDDLCFGGTTCDLKMMVYLLWRANNFMELNEFERNM